VVTGLKGQVFYADQQKYLIPYFTVDNCVFRMEGASNKTFFDFNGGGFVENLTVTNSTLSGDDATQWSDGGFFSTQSGSTFAEAGAQKFTQTLTNNTFYNVAKGQTLSTLWQNSKPWMSFEVMHNVIVNSGMKGEFVKGLNAGQDKSAPNWLVQYNSFTFDGADVGASEISGASNIPIAANVEGEIVFANGDDGIAEGDFSLGACPQKEAKIGDPRWLVEIIGDPITLALTGGADISSALDAALAENVNPQSVTITLGVGNYTVSSPLEVSCPLTIEGDTSGPVSLDASALEAPMIQLGGKEGYSSTLNEQEFYDIGNVRIANVAVKGLARQLFYANSTKYLIDELTLDNSIV
jgi:hypothetical protein